MADDFHQRRIGASYEEIRNDAELKARLANPKVSRRRDECKHGGPSPSQERMVAVAQYVDCVSGAQEDIPTLVLLAAQWAQLRSAAVCSETAQIVNGMAADAVLAEDWAPAAAFARQAAALRALGGAAGDPAAEVLRVTLRLCDEARNSSNWAVRRAVARVAGCGCLGRLAVAACAFPGCGAAHDPDAAGGAKLRVCSRCSRVHYCSETHQRGDWKRHKAACDPKTTPKAG